MTPGGRRITLVAAVADNGVIGADGAIPWRLPADFAHFKALTTGHVLVMGRATWDSIGRPLPDRETVVLTRDDARSDTLAAAGAHVARDLAGALALADGLIERGLLIEPGPDERGPDERGPDERGPDERGPDERGQPGGVGGEVMVVGGAAVYAAALPVADRQVLTRVSGAPPGDTRYPAYDEGAWVEVRRDEHDGFAISWLEPA